jgi:chitinase
MNILQSLLSKPVKLWHSYAKKVACAALLCVVSLSVSAQFKVVGYEPSWAGAVSDIQFNKLTHINYAFILPNSSGGLNALENPSKLQSMVSTGHANNVKVLIAVGGWNNGDDSAFENLAGNASSRTNFVNNLVNLVNQYNLDGVDIDWEYPDNGTSSNNYSALMSELSNAMHSRGKLLSAAVVAVGGASIQANVFGYVDHLNLMAYDGGGSNHSTYDYAVQSINYWKGRGLPTNKVILGVPFYGRSSTEYVNYDALLARGASPNSDFFGNIGYNGIPTIKSKTNLAFDQCGGIMIWDLDADITNANSLLTAINQVVLQRSGPSGCTGAFTSIPGTIQAESYCQMSGIQTETTTDTGGGQNVGYIDAGDYMAYRVNIPSTGTYTIQYRVASQSGGGSIRFERLGGGTTFGTIAVGATGGWQTWTTISHSVQLTAGQQDVAIAAASGGFNINWFNISGNTPPPTAPIGQTIWLKGSNNLYVSSENGTTPMNCTRTSVAAWEQFTVVDAGGGKIALRGMNKYVSSENGAASGITCNRTAIGGWEIFDWVVNPDGKISLRGSNGLYVSSENGTKAMTCSRTTIGGWEVFTWGTGTPSGRMAAPGNETESANLQNAEIQFFPNPVINSLNYSLPAHTAEHHIRVINANGDKIFTAEYGNIGEKNTIDVSSWKEGLYIIRVFNSDFHKTFKVFKK